MKRQSIIFTILVLAISSCSQKTENVELSSSINSERYHGPIIDMHVHAYNEVSPIFGMEMINPLTDKSYIGAESLQKHQEETFARFKKYNIVKAVVSHHAEKWYNIDSSLILIGKGHHFPTAELRKLHTQGKLHVLAEVAPSYDGLLPTDKSLSEYFDLAEELDIPIGYHMFPGGPPGGAYFAAPKTRAHQGKPLQFEEILLKRPNMRLYIMHAGWPYLEDMKALMYAHLQVYVDLGAIS